MSNTTMAQPTALTTQQAQLIINAAQEEAQRLGVPMNIAIVDEGNNLMAFLRMDKAWLGSISIAQNKAYTARAFDMPTKDLFALCQPGQPLFGIQHSNNSQLIVFAGGIPLVQNGVVMGAVGVSGGTVEQDQQVAEAAVKAFAAMNL
jgi:uncharacterized protein GlcG (DUF336 family)